MTNFYCMSGTARFGPIFSASATRDGWRAVRNRWLELVQPVPGALDAVHRLAARWDVCVVANQPPECLDALQQLGLGSALKLVALDSVVGYAKPDPRLLGWALHELGTPAVKTVMIGNRWDHDIVPARALGCQTVLIRQDHAWVAPEGSDPEILAAYCSLMRTRWTPPASLGATEVADSLAQFALNADCRPEAGCHREDCDA
jgi:FMN phosphatase YigB (HAD superfamily)